MILSSKFLKQNKNNLKNEVNSYTAPEVLFELGQTKDIDWWQLGCLIY